MCNVVTQIFVAASFPQIVLYSSISNDEVRKYTSDGPLLQGKGRKLITAHIQCKASLSIKITWKLVKTGRTNLVVDGLGTQVFRPSLGGERKIRN